MWVNSHGSLCGLQVEVPVLGIYRECFSPYPRSQHWPSHAGTGTLKGHLLFLMPWHLPLFSHRTTISEFVQVNVISISNVCMGMFDKAHFGNWKQMCLLNSRSLNTLF